MTTILIVDDEEMIIKQLDRLTRSFGYDSTSTVLPGYVIRILEEIRIDLILMDVNMPELDGLTLLKQLKAHPKFQMIPVIMLTAYTEDKVLKDCFAAGAVDYINKPIQEVVLSARIQSAIRTQNHIKEIKDHLQEIEKIHKELKETEAQLVESAKLVALGQMAEGIAHEINNPLFGIQMCADLAIESLQDAGENDSISYLKEIQALVSRCSTITEHLLEFSPNKMGEQTSIQIPQIIQKVLLFKEEHLKKNQIQLKVEFSDDLPLVEGKPLDIELALLNILSNAVDAMESSPHKELSIRLFLRTRQIVVEIEDSGCGIPPKIQQKVFEPFFTTKKVGQGKGLGLSLSYGIVQDHQGQISISSQEGQGTIVTIILPISDQQ